MKRKRQFNIGVYQHSKKIAIENAEAEQSRTVEALRNCLVGEVRGVGNAHTKKTTMAHIAHHFFFFSIEIVISNACYKFRLVDFF